jgi:hypothetical protein
MQRRSLGVAFGLTAVLCLPTCKGGDERAKNAKKVTVNSTDDATDAIVDEDYRFRMDWPGTGWKLLREKDVKRLLPDAVAGAMYQNKAFGAIVVESAPGVDLEAFTRLISENMLLEEKSVDEFENVKLDGRDAIRFTATGKANGIQFRYTDIVFLHQGYAYQVIGWGMADQTNADGSSFQPLFDSFHITDGEVKGRSNTTLVKSAHGVGWRIKEGVFESAVSRLKVEPKDPWRVAVGAELEQMSGDAEVGITRAGPEAYAVFVVERAPKKNERKAYVDSLTATLGSSLGLEQQKERWTGTFAGSRLEFHRYRTTQAPIFEYLYGVHFEGDQLVQITAWYLAAEQERVMGEIQAGLDTVSFIGPERAGALAGQLRQMGDPRDAVGGGFALRNGEYRDFNRGWRWTKPGDGFWRIAAGEEARLVRTDLTLYMSEPTLGVYGMVIDDTAEGFTPETYHQAVLTTMDGNKKPRGARAVGGATVHTSTVDQKAEGGPTRYHVSTLIHGARAVQMIFWGLPEDIEAADATLSAALDGFHFDDGPVDPITTTENEYHDERMGFAVRLPTKGWRFQDMTPATVREAGSVVFWQQGSRVIGVVAVHALENADDTDWFLDFLEQLARDQFGQLANVSPKRKQTTLAGVPARQLSWSMGVERLDAYLVVRGKTIYALLTGGPTDGSDLLTKVLTGFRLLD